MKHYQGHELGKAEFSDRDASKYHRTNEFFHRASEAMGLDWEKGKRVTRIILRDVIKRISAKTAQDFISNLPLGLKQECSVHTIGPLKSIGYEKLTRDIKRAAQSSQVDAQAIGRLFWLFLEGELHEGPCVSKGILAKVLSELPHDLRRLLTRQENAL